MIIKLTKLGCSILINLQNVASFETMNSPQGQLTKVWLTNGTYINVEESLEDILNLQQNFLMGHYQDTKTITKPFVERMEDSFNATARKPRTNRKYPTNELFNNKEW